MGQELKWVHDEKDWGLSFVDWGGTGSVEIRVEEIWVLRLREMDTEEVLALERAISLIVAFRIFVINYEHRERERERGDSP